MISNSISSSSFGSTGSFLEYQRIIDILKRGDLIEVHRNQYRHWVICESIESNGTVWCFHVTTPGIEMESENVVRKEIAFNGKAVLKYEPLKDILKDTEDGKMSLCRQNNQKNMARKMSDTFENSLPDLDQVFKVLHNLKDKIFKYDLRSLNCEHYCTFWRYGIGWSSQVNTFKDIVAAILQFTSVSTKTMAEIASRIGWHKIGMVCLLISTFAPMAADVIKGIEYTLNDLKIDNLEKLAVLS